MKEIILIYGKRCLESRYSLEFVEELKNEFEDIEIKTIEFSFSNDFIKELGIVITPTFVFNNKIICIGTPEKNFLLEKINEL